MREMGSSAAVWKGEVSAGGAGRGLLLICCAQSFGLERGKGSGDGRTADH